MYTVELSRNGLKTLLFDGKAIHSRFDPLKEGQIFYKEHQDLLQNSDYKLLVFIGNFGLGYILSHLLSQPLNFGLVKVYVISLGEEEFLFKQHGITELETKIDIRFINPFVSQELHLLNKALDQVKIKNMIIKAPIHILKILGDQYIKALTIVDTMIKQHLFNILTDSAFGKRWWHNFIINYAQQNIQYVSISKMQPTPILIVGSGYSTYLNRSLIKKKSESLYIMSILPALGLLLKNQIVPNLVFITDGGEANRYYREIASLDPCKTIVCCYPHVLPLVLRRFKGKVYFFNSGLEMESVLTPFLPNIPSAGSVASTLLYFAAQLSTTVEYVGFDFCYMNAHPHFPGSVLETEYLLRSTRLAPAETIMAQKVYKADNPSFGGWKSSAAMQAYQKHFMGELGRLQVKGTQVRMIEDSSSNGVSKPFSAHLLKEHLVSKDEKITRFEALVTALEKILSGNEDRSLIKLITNRAELKGEEVSPLIEKEILLVKRHLNTLKSQ